MVPILIMILPILNLVLWVTNWSITRVEIFTTNHNNFKNQPTFYRESLVWLNELSFYESLRLTDRDSLTDRQTIDSTWINGWVLSLQVQCHSRLPKKTENVPPIPNWTKNTNKQLKCWIGIRLILNTNSQKAINQILFFKLNLSEHCSI